MKKLMVLALVLAAVGFLTDVQAQSTFTASSQLPEGAQQARPQLTGKQQIKSEELPKAVQQALKKETLKNWQISEVFYITGTVQQADPKPMYEVYLTDADKHKTVARFYKNGKTVTGRE